MVGPTSSVSAASLSSTTLSSDVLPSVKHSRQRATSSPASRLGVNRENKVELIG